VVSSKRSTSPSAYSAYYVVAADETGRVQLAGGVADITTVLVVKIDGARDAW
jgi:hypothetical protein